MSAPDPLFTGNLVAAPTAMPVSAGAPQATEGGFDALMALHMSDRPAPAADNAPDKADYKADDNTQASQTVAEIAAQGPAEKPEPKAVNAQPATHADAAPKDSKDGTKETTSVATAAPADNTGKDAKATGDEKTVDGAAVAVAPSDTLPQIQPAPQTDVTAQAAAVLAQAAATPATTDDQTAQATEAAAAETPSAELKARIAASATAPAPAQVQTKPASGKTAEQKSDTLLAAGTDANDAAPVATTVDLPAKAVKAAAQSSGGDANGDKTSDDTGKDQQAQTQATGADAKTTVAKVRSVLDAFQPTTPSATATVQSDVAAAQPQTTTTADPVVSSAFSLQSLQDTSGSYSAMGASTTAASNMSKAAVETLSALSMQISKRLAEGSTKFAIELHPADLGKVEVTMNIARDGKTTAHLRFDTPITAATFSSAEGELRQQLAQTGLTFDKDSLSFSSRDGGSDFGASLADQQGSSQGQARQAARALQAAGKVAEETDANVALDTALANFRNRSSQSLALNLIV